ncbi:hypothetical protein [Aquisalimonas asiatica]|uniref:5-bromo-4-chloroindolyl phosphate hydrolysis protein n=1 Tax=Aquisalimonas asiatica TaxID=406100 RepID=A0A1H8VHY5_9GAMM|nr:hypothetical protein [Aquisalimonas asiatica]SEP14981.1 hypothetical protein SAMN04488052_11293 [Aquisalimonas asiatica]
MTPDPRVPRRTYTAAAAVMIAIAGLGLGGIWSLAGVVAGLLVAAVHVWRFERRHAPQQRESRGDTGVLWQDAEAALRHFDRHDDATLRPVLDRVGRAGRRVVEQGRRTPGDQRTGHARQLLCTAADALLAHDHLPAGRRAANQDTIHSLLETVAAELEQEGEPDADERAAQVRMRVLEQQLRTGRGQS